MVGALPEFDVSKLSTTSLYVSILIMLCHNFSNMLPGSLSPARRSKSADTESRSRSTAVRISSDLSTNTRAATKRDSKTLPIREGDDHVVNAPADELPVSAVTREGDASDLKLQSAPAVAPKVMELTSSKTMTPARTNSSSLSLSKTSPTKSPTIPSKLAVPSGKQGKPEHRAKVGSIGRSSALKKSSIPSSKSTDETEFSSAKMASVVPVAVDFNSVHQSEIRQPKSKTPRSTSAPPRPTALSTGAPSKMSVPASTLTKVGPSSAKMVPIAAKTIPAAPSSHTKASPAPVNITSASSTATKITLSKTAPTSSANVPPKNSVSGKTIMQAPPITATELPKKTATPRQPTDSGRQANKRQVASHKVFLLHSLSDQTSVRLSLFVHLSIFLFIHLFICLFFCPFI